MAWSKESRQSRGYGSEWQKIRARVIERDLGMCQECKRKGRVVKGMDVDHKISKAKARQLGWVQTQIEAMSNLEFLCRRCHDEKTARETGRVYRPKIQIGEDGWPIE